MSGVEAVEYCVWCQATRPVGHQCIGFGLVQPQLIGDAEMPDPPDIYTDLPD